MSDDVTINLQKDMAYHVVGKIRLRDSQGREYDLEGEETWLCRCGHSKRKPFCDGSHRKAGFESDPTANEFTS